MRNYSQGQSPYTASKYGASIANANFQSLGSGPSPYSRQNSHYGKGPKGYRRPDERIQEDVCQRLSDDEHIDASDIEVDVKNAAVTLTGQVVDRFSKRHAEDIAERVSGVVDINNQIRINTESLAAHGMSLKIAYDKSKSFFKSK